MIKTVKSASFYLTGLYRCSRILDISIIWTTKFHIEPTRELGRCVVFVQSNICIIFIFVFM